MKSVAIFLYERSGKSAEPFAAAGWECYCIDLAHDRTWSRNGVHFVQADARSWKPTRSMVERCRFFAAFPPCDHLAVSGARWFKGKGLRSLSGSVELFAIAAEWAEFFEVPYLIENPVSTIATYWRKPDHVFNPSDFAGLERADNYTKKTCLWTGGGLAMPAPTRLIVRLGKLTLKAPADTTRIHHMRPGPDRARLRSETPIGFMRAVFATNFGESATT